MNIPRILSIAGSDSGGGAGIQADLKTTAALGCFGMTAITAITAQNTLSVNAIQTVNLNLIEAQIDAVFNDIGVDAVKVGMLGSPEIVELVAKSLKKWGPKILIVDPVLRSTSGTNLGGNASADSLIKYLLPIATMVTPNLDEAKLLTRRSINEISDLKDIANALLQLGSKSVLLKGGHLDLQLTELIDTLAVHENDAVTNYSFKHPRIHTKNSHGTGCTLSTAIACHMAQGLPISQAVEYSIEFVQKCLIAGKSLAIGQGVGPLWHMHEQFKLNS